MKWTLALLVGLGILASVCIVMLVNAFRTDSALRAKRGEIPVVVVSKDLPAWSVLSAEDVEISKITKSDAPADCFVNTALVVGKVLSMDVVKGEIVTKSKILAQGTPADIAALLGPGMRAVSVTVSGEQISGGLLYPRCFVDVLASFQIRDSRNTQSKGEALATTLLERVKVLAIAGESMLNNPNAEEKGSTRSSSRRLTVTLELDSKQAEAMQLAMNNGQISLVLRNPLDTEPVNPEPTVLDRGRLSRLGELLGSNVKPSGPRGEGGQTEDGSDDAAKPVMNGWSDSEPSHWGVTVIRGQKVVEEEVKTE